MFSVRDIGKPSETENVVPTTFARTRVCKKQRTERRKYRAKPTEKIDMYIYIYMCIFFFLLFIDRSQSKFSNETHISRYTFSGRMQIRNENDVSRIDFVGPRRIVCAGRPPVNNAGSAIYGSVRVDLRAILFRSYWMLSCFLHRGERKKRYRENTSHILTIVIIINCYTYALYVNGAQL